MKSIDISGSFDTRTSARGVCDKCGREHSMVVGYAAKYARELLDILIEKRRIDFDVADEEADPQFSTDYLFGDARGQMFGVLVCRDMQGRHGLLKAFSGQYNGAWNVEGWVPPLINTDVLHDMSFGVERLIKSMGQKIDALPAQSIEREQLAAKRKAVSQALMKDIHAQYKLPNFRGELKTLPEAIHGEGGIPTGTGDCCAPKLLGYAARHSLTPLGVAEFYFGRENKSGTKRHGGMYTSCKEKCWRILGHMLCGQGSTCPRFPTD